MEWLETQTARLWKLCGPTPGPAAALAYLRIERFHMVARELIAAAGDGDVWQLIEAGFGIGRRRAGKKNLQLNVAYSSQPGAQYSYWATSSEDVKLELAWRSRSTSRRVRSSR